MAMYVEIRSEHNLMVEERIGELGGTVLIASFG